MHVYLAVAATLGRENDERCDTNIEIQYIFVIIVYITGHCLLLDDHCHKMQVLLMLFSTVECDTHTPIIVIEIIFNCLYLYESCRSTI